MKKLLSFILTILIFLGIASYFYSEYKHQIELPPFLESLIPLNSTEASEYALSINTNTRSNLALLAISEDNHGYAAFTKTVRGTEILDKIILHSKTSEQALLEVNDIGLPTKFESAAGEVRFSNYTDNTVDLEIIFTDGSTNSILAAPLNLPKKEVSFSFIQAAHAAEQGIPPTNGVTRADEESFLSYITASTGTALNIIACGATLGSALYTGGATSPFAYLKCAPLAVRLSTNYIDIGPCDYDVLDCASNAIIDSFKEPGPTIGGIITSSITQKPLEGVIVSIMDKQGRTKARATSGTYGHYTLPSIDLGGYTLMFSHKEGESTYILATTNNRIQINGEDTVTLDEAYTDERQGFTKIANYFGSEVNQLFHTRFDVSLGQPGKFDGLWSGSATSFQEAIGDTECATASFEWEIKDNGIDGVAIVDEDYEVKLQGGVDGAGSIKAGTGLSFIEQVTFVGDLTETTGSGTWKAASGCSGSWTAAKDNGIVNPKDEIQPVF